MAWLSEHLAIRKSGERGGNESTWARAFCSGHFVRLAISCGAFYSEPDRSDAFTPLHLSDLEHLYHLCSSIFFTHRAFT